MDAFYRVPLTSGEALATLAALRALETWIAAGAPETEIEPGILQSAAARIAEEVPDFLSDQARALSATLVHALRSAPRLPDDEENAVREKPPFPTRRTRRLLEDAFERAVPVEIEYFVQSRGEWTTRRVEISDLFTRDDSWYMAGHCELRGDFRQFRLDHIRAVRVLDEATVPDPFTAE